MGDEHDPVVDGQQDEEDADSGTMSDHGDPHPGGDEAPRRH